MRALGLEPCQHGNGGEEEKSEDDDNDVDKDDIGGEVISMI